MKPHYIITLLLLAALYWMYLLYQPFLLSMMIAALLAVSTANIQCSIERRSGSALLAASLSTLLLSMLFFAPLGYFLTTLTLYLNNLDPAVLQKFYAKLQALVDDAPAMLGFVKPHLENALDEISLSNMATHALTIASTVGSYSASFVKNALFIIIFYFFAQYHGRSIFHYIKRVAQLPQQDTTLLSFELSSVMSVVFYSIITTAAFEGALFGIAVTFMGYNGLLFGIMYGFASLLPVVGGVLMWLPFMLYELAQGHTGNAVFITLYSIIVISIIADTFVKPVIIKEINQRLVKTDTKMNELLIFFAIIAGLATFGFWGMILGPAITAFFLSLVKLIEQRQVPSSAEENAS